jgi:hypothetical protein
MDGGEDEKIGETPKLPQVTYCALLTDLHEPYSYTFHGFHSRLESSPPVCLPF